MPLHHRDARFESVGQHGPPSGFYEGDGGNLIPGQQRALVRSPKDHALRGEFEPGPHGPAHREEADERRQDGGPANAVAGKQEDDTAQLGHAGERQEERPGQAGVDDAAHTTTLTPPAPISARRTLPRYTSPST